MVFTKNIMNTHIQVVRDNNWIYDCVSPWDYRLLLATKSYQEGCIDIKDFIWRLCVSYRSLNSVTRSFKFTIPRCTDIIEDFSDSSVSIHFFRLMIDLDTIQLVFSTATKKNIIYYTI